MQVFLCVLNKQTNARMSKVHSNNAKVAEGMKEHITKLQKMFCGGVCDCPVHPDQ